MNKKTFCFVMPEYSYGGVSRTAHNLAKVIACQGHNVTMILLRKSAQEAPYAQEEITNFRSVYLFKQCIPYFGLLALIPVIIWRLIFLTRKYGQSKTYQINIVSHGLLCSILVALSSYFRTPIRLVHIAFEHSVPSIQYVGLRGRVKWAALGLIAARASALVGVSLGVRDDIRQVFPTHKEKIHCIYNGFDITKIRSLGGATSNTKSPGGRFSVVCVGRLSTQKNLPLILSTASLLADFPIAFTVVGGGPLVKSLRSAATRLKLRNVDFIGERSNPYVYMSECDLLILTSDYESFGNVLVEALALGKAVVSTDCPVGPAEILDNGRVGRLVPMNDSQALKDAILRAFRDPTLNEPANVNARCKRAEDFSLERQCTNFLNLINRLSGDILPLTEEKKR